jgi:hypothetical protein
MVDIWIIFMLNHVLAGMHRQCGLSSQTFDDAGGFGRGLAVELLICCSKCTPSTLPSGPTAPPADKSAAAKFGFFLMSFSLCRVW